MWVQADHNLYQKECAHKQGFKRVWTKREARIQLTYTDFASVMHSWQVKASRVFQACLASKEYQHIRNALTVLNRVHKVWFFELAELPVLLVLS